MLGRKAEHTFGADIEHLDYTACIRRDDREIGTAEYRVLQRSRFEQFGLRRLSSEKAAAAPYRCAPRLPPEPCGIDGTERDWGALR
jgi:hypothetical protein